MATRNLTVKLQVRRDTAANWESRNPILAAGEIGYDTTNKLTKIGDGTTAWNNLTKFITASEFPTISFQNDSWDKIASIAASGEADVYYAVGDEKTITLTTGERVTLVILGFNHDDLTAGGKAPITIGMKNLLATTYPMNSTATNAGGWNNSAMRTSTMATLLSQLPADLRAAIKLVSKKASAGSASTSITTSADKLWLFREVEIDNTTTEVYASEGSQYEYWRTIKDGTIAADRIKKLSNGGGSTNNWWLRSPRMGNNSSFSCVNGRGSVSNYTADTTCGVSFGFCV